ncbi:hypothetical protein Q1W73_05480 [Asticcacaulis sp. ZE23SCel15]|uniref:hypothetical protein n=1 Tax=Asticcacaulis sp. ZE23SCel15 TaxID=3059027 RepID=UPI00265FB8D0|nr:hypothetical protein [Asticcacaulis sp. ZE23SCel15]WKL58437.1 hypothetical protein Q1W73_05480 [Asticcacaulis sp. ZE23SCel15]
MTAYNATRYIPPAHPVVQPYSGGYDAVEARPEARPEPLFEDLYDVHDDFNDIALYVTRAEGYRDE